MIPGVCLFQKYPTFDLGVTGKKVPRFADPITVNVLSMGLPEIGLLGTRAPWFCEILVGNTGTPALYSGKRRLVACHTGTHTTVGIMVSDGMLTEG